LDKRGDWKCPECRDAIEAAAGNEDEDHVKKDVDNKEETRSKFSTKCEDSRPRSLIVETRKGKLRVHREAYGTTGQDSTNEN
jgi:hypothetical protein